MKVAADPNGMNFFLQFAETVTRDELPKGSGPADRVEEAAIRMDFDPENVLVVDDDLLALEEAAARGFPTAHFLNGRPPEAGSQANFTFARWLDFRVDAFDFRRPPPLVPPPRREVAERGPVDWTKAPVLLAPEDYPF
jgi:beta-phosphoglucomutase-like phosphatase (HAD superfamily)